MNIGINANQIFASIRDRGQNQADTWANQARSSVASRNKSDSTTSVRSLEYQQRTQQKQSKSVVDQSMRYADSLRNSRVKAKETSLEKKKLQYSYKKISSQIVRSKTSVTARKAASAARREVLRLKRLRASGEYDEEELQISIEHAKSMERIAKKKVAHLQQEEMIERGRHSALSGLQEKEEEQDQEKEPEEEPVESEEEIPEDEDYMSEMQIMMADIQDEMAFRMEELSEEMQAQIQEVMESNQDSMDEMMSDMMKMVQDAMEEMDEVLDLDELANTMVAPDPNMSEDDLKMLKMKHRTKEMKEIAKADGEYLKAIMDKYEKKGIAGTGPSSAAASSTPVFSGASAISGDVTPIKVTVPVSYGSEGAAMSFDAFA